MSPMLGFIGLQFLANGLQFGFEFGDALAQWSGGVLDLRGGETRGDKPRAISVVAENADDEDSLDLRAVSAGRD